MTKPVSRLNLTKPKTLEMTKPRKKYGHERRKCPCTSHSLKN